MSRDDQSHRQVISATKNYRLFAFSADNRPRNDKKHRKLFRSMQRYGFLRSFPVVCHRDASGAIIVKDGQHRLMFAEELNLTVYYTVEAVDFDIAVINSTAKVWSLVDYAEKHAAHGLAAYAEGLQFANRFKLPIGTAFGLLAGTTSFSNIQNSFEDGTFQVKDMAWAESVAFLSNSLAAVSRDLSNKRVVEACMACCRVPGFDVHRLLAGAKRHPEALKPYSTRDGYLDMFETIYNFGRKQLVPLKIHALQAMRDRAAVKPAAAKAGAEQ